jgi:hypothetical protein
MVYLMMQSAAQTTAWQTTGWFKNNEFKQKWKERALA